MAKFRVLLQQDAFVEFTAEIDADTLEAAVDRAYADRSSVQWQRRDVQCYDACRVVAIDDADAEIGDYSRGRF